MSMTPVPNEYEDWLRRIKEFIAQARRRAITDVNVKLTFTYWTIGREIAARQAADGWGASVVEQIAADLRSEFPEMTGLSPRNLRYMLKLAKEWPDFAILQQAAAKLPWGSNQVLLDRVRTPELRRWYAQTALENNWSRPVLVHQIESRAASFALIAYVSSWLKCWHPDVFCAALLNAQPMGFYAPAQIVRDAQEHGVEIRPVCVDASRWDCTLEPRTPKSSADDDGRFAVRLGLRMVRALGNADAARLVAARGDTPFASVDDLWRRARVPHAALTELAEADAFRPSTGLSRRDALWAIKALRDEPLPLFAAAAEREAATVSEQVEPVVRLRAMPEGGEVVEDYGHVGLTLRQHPVSFLRAELARRRHITCAEAMASRDRRWVEVAGLVLVRQRPGSAKGVMFITIEDETGVANLVVWTKVFEAHRRVVLGAGMMGVRGRIQREGEVVHLVAHSLSDLSRDFARVGLRGRTGEADDGPTIPFVSKTPRLPPAKIMSDPYGHVVDEIRVKTRDFR